MKSRAVRTTCYYAIICLFPHCASSAFSEVTCPGQTDYCDCEGDCTGQPQWCACDEAQECCRGATPTVLCLDQPQENYCDCEGDCTEQPAWCACTEARTCCSESTNDGDNYDHDYYTDESFLQLAFNRYSGSDTSMDHEEWSIFVRELKLLACDDATQCETDSEKNRLDSIWYDISEPFFSYDNFLTALGKVALDRKENDQDRNAISEIHRWIAQNHADEEHTFCHNVDNDVGTSRSIGNEEGMSGSISIKAFDFFMVTAIAFACGIFVGMINVRYSSNSKNNNPFTPILKK